MKITNPFQPIWQKTQKIYSNFKKSSKLHHLDGIRGWASISVVLGHLGTMLYKDYIWENPRVSRFTPFFTKILLWPGSLAVTIFFILSGRVLAISFLKSKDPAKLASAAIRRPFRLAIPVFVSLVLHYIFQHANFYNPNIERATPFVNASLGMSWVKPLKEANTIRNIPHLISSTVMLFVPPYIEPRKLYHTHIHFEKY